VVDPKSFEQFYEEYSHFVYQLALQIVKKKEDAEDICHDVFLEISKNPNSYDPSRGSIEAWLAIKTKSRSFDQLRRKKYRLQYDEQNRFFTVETTERVEENVFRQLEKEALLHALKRIPKLQQLAVYENFFNQRSHRQLAEELNRPLGTIKSLIRYGLKNLRKQLEGTGWKDSCKEGKKYDV